MVVSAGRHWCPGGLWLLLRSLTEVVGWEAAPLPLLLVVCACMAPLLMIPRAPASRAYAVWCVVWEDPSVGGQRKGPHGCDEGAGGGWGQCQQSHQCECAALLAAAGPVRCELQSPRLAAHMHALTHAHVHTPVQVHTHTHTEIHGNLHALD